MKSSFISRVATIGGLALGAFALSAFAGTWVAPSAPAPGGNPDAPVNVGSVTQTKLGWLGVKGLVATDLTLATGTPAAGMVLTAIDSLGNAKWQTPSGGGGGGATGDVIVCSATGSTFSNPQGTVTKTFSAGDCTGGVLPTSAYKGALKSIAPDNALTPLMLTAVNAYDAGEPNGPGFSFSYNRVGSTVSTGVGTVVYTKLGPIAGSSDKNYVIPTMSSITSKNISYYPCTHITNNTCDAFGTLTTETVSAALGRFGGTFIYNGSLSSNKICATFFSDAPYVLSYSTKAWSSPGDNGVIYWDVAKNAFVLRNANGMNSGVDYAAPFTCSSIETVTVSS
jgi:hypothetical protein